MNFINQNNMPFFDIKDAKYLFKKLEYDFLLLTKENPNPYNYLNFIFTAYHLKEWVIKDTNFNTVKITNCKKLFDHKSNYEFDVIRSLCNRGKHFLLDKTQNIDKMKNEGFSFSKINFKNFTFSGPTYYIMANGKQVNLYDICKKTYSDWEAFFK